jgi:hypothetical protein
MADFSATADALKIFLSGIAGILGVVVGRRSVNVKADPPLDVSLKQRFVTCEQCEAHRKAMTERVDAVETMQTRVLDKLDMIEQHNEDRARRLHARLDPISESAAKSAALLANHLEDHRNGK